MKQLIEIKAICSKCNREFYTTTPRPTGYSKKKRIERNLRCERCLYDNVVTIRNNNVAVENV